MPRGVATPPSGSITAHVKHGYPCSPVPAINYSQGDSRWLMTCYSGVR